MCWLSFERDYSNLHSWGTASKLGGRYEDILKCMLCRTSKKESYMVYLMCDWIWCSKGSFDNCLRGLCRVLCNVPAPISLHIVELSVTVP